ncbi:patatin-like phospholipase family protein [bacterium]|nr:patatin-like phospholipase family protein [bacterium]
MRRLSYILSLLILLVTFDPEVFARQKIGLALGGGGARGASHIGVLRALEEMRIPIDYIAGTSMGAIVGGLYASGMTIDEIEKLLLTIDWADMFNDSPAYQDLSFRRKEDVSADLFDLAFGVQGWKLKMPAGLITGQKVRFLLQTKTLHTEGLKTFDDLPIPFRTVATDIETGEKVVISRGNLAEAIHASFAIPGIISPVEINGRLLVDGGLVSQVPVEIVRAMGADVVIGVNVSSGLTSREKLASFAAVTMQVINLMIHNNEIKETVKADILITPDLEDIFSTDFEKSLEITVLGEKAVEKVKDLLQPYIVTEAEYDKMIVIREKMSMQDEINVDFLYVHNKSSVSNRWIVENIQTHVGRKLDLEILNDDLQWLYQTNEFEIVDFRVIHRGEKTGLSILAREKPWGNDTFRFGMSLSDNFEGESHYSLNARYINTRINKLGAEWRTDVQVGREGLLKSEFYQPLAYKTNYFVSMTGIYHRYYANFFEDQQKTGDYRVYQYSAQTDFGLELGKYGEIRLGGFIDRIEARLDTGKELVERQKFDLWGVTGKVTIDQTNNPKFPTQGYYFSVEYTVCRDIRLDEDYFQRIQADYDCYYKCGRNVFFANISAGTKLGYDLPFHLKYSLGGPFSLTGYEKGEIMGQHMTLLRTGYFRQIAIMPAVMGSDLYMGVYAEAGNAVDDFGDIGLDELIYTGNLFIGLDTFLGPIFLGYGMTDTGKESVYLRLGHVL